MHRGELFILSAPSGAGKTTLIRRLLAQELLGFDQPYFAISHTTRPPRAGEVDGREYSFCSRPHFLAMVERGEFLEWAEVYDNCYGTPLGQVLPALENGVDVLLDIDVQGTARVLAQHRAREGGVALSPLDCAIHTVFVLPPSPDALASRIGGRRTEDDRTKARRLAEAAREVRQLDLYDYVIVNDDVIAASRSLASILIDKQMRRERADDRVRPIVEAFARLQQT